MDLLKAEVVRTLMNVLQLPKSTTVVQMPSVSTLNPSGAVNARLDLLEMESLVQVI